MVMRENGAAKRVQLEKKTFPVFIMTAASHIKPH